jgi:hypothetical protein
MPYGNINVDTVTTSTAGGILGAGNASIMKNRIINGAMVIDQRNAGASVTPTDGAYTLDRWQASVSQTSKLTVQQNAGSVTPPVGFVNYLVVTSTSAYTPLAAGDYFSINQCIEGFNSADLGWGSANAKTVTLSFWVRSSLTGTFGGVTRNADGTRSYPFTYTISAANTWEQKSVTIAGDTSGTWTTTNGIGIRLLFGLGVGSTFSGTAGSWASANYFSATGATSVVGTSGATFYITGVQLEVGSSATGFEYRQYGTELSLCYRFFQQLKGAGNYGYSTNGFTQAISSGDSYGVLPYLGTFRSAPTITTSGTFQLIDQSNTITVSSITLDSRFTSTNYGDMRVAPASSSLTQYRIYNIRNANDSAAYINLSAEL